MYDCAADVDQIDVDRPRRVSKGADSPDLRFDVERLFEKLIRGKLAARSEHQIVEIRLVSNAFRRGSVHGGNPLDRHQLRKRLNGMP